MPETNFFWDPLSDNILQERDSSGAVTAEYTTEPGPYGNLISQNRGGVESQYHFDALGSTLALTDDNQQVSGTYAYSAFGEVTEVSGTTVNPFQYIGQNGYYHAQGFSHSHIRRRSYAPGISRWISLDPLRALEPFVGPYVYCRNNGTNRIDPAGLLPEGYVCPKGYFYISRGLPFEKDGCSVPWWWLWWYGIPDKDSPPNATNFKDACDAHDECYETCHQTKLQCDFDFENAMLDACMRALGGGEDSPLRNPGFTIQKCRQLAKTYGAGVVIGGGGGWDNCQRRWCHCCMPCDPNQEFCVDPIPGTPPALF